MLDSSVGMETAASNVLQEIEAKPTTDESPFGLIETEPEEKAADPLAIEREQLVVDEKVMSRTTDTGSLKDLGVLPPSDPVLVGENELELPRLNLEINDAGSAEVKKTEIADSEAFSEWTSPTRLDEIFPGSRPEIDPEPEVAEEGEDSVADVVKNVKGEDGESCDALMDEEGGSLVGNDTVVVGKEGLKEVKVKKIEIPDSEGESDISSPVKSVVDEGGFKDTVADKMDASTGSTESKKGGKVYSGNLNTERENEHMQTSIDTDANEPVSSRGVSEIRDNTIALDAIVVDSEADQAEPSFGEANETSRTNGKTPYLAVVEGENARQRSRLESTQLNSSKPLELIEEKEQLEEDILASADSNHEVEAELKPSTQEEEDISFIETSDLDINKKEPVLNPPSLPSTTPAEISTTAESYTPMSDIPPSSSSLQEPSTVVDIPPSEPEFEPTPSLSTQDSTKGAQKMKIDSSLKKRPLREDEAAGTGSTSDVEAKDLLMAELKAMKIASIQARNASLIAEIADKRARLAEATKTLTAPASQTVKTHIKLLHNYNDIRDVGQGLVGMIAENRGVRIGDLYEEFGVGLKD